MKPTKLPPRQQLTQKFPVVGERRADRELSEASWRLAVYSDNKKSLELGFADLLALPQIEMSWNIHCVTRWSRVGDRFSGVLFKDLLAAGNIALDAKFARFIAYSDRRHDTSLPLSVCLEEPVILVHKINGAPLAPEHGFPVRTFAPGRYFYKSLKWLKEIHLVNEDTLGYWERGGYHNAADYHQEQRYTSGNLTARELAKLRQSRDFSKYKGQVLLSLDLSELDLTGADLSDVQLKNCNLQSSQLPGANLRSANLSNSSLVNSNLTGADLTGADLDGTLLMGCDLASAKLDKTFLNATQFSSPGFKPACVNKTSFSEAQIDGLVEEQVQFLTGQGVAF